MVARRLLALLCWGVLFGAFYTAYAHGHGLLLLAAVCGFLPGAICSALVFLVGGADATLGGRIFETRAWLVVGVYGCLPLALRSAGGVAFTAGWLLAWIAVGVYRRHEP